MISRQPRPPFRGQRSPSGWRRAASSGGHIRSCCGWVPSDAIKSQTLETLKDRDHAYRRRLDENFGGHLRLFDIAEFETLRPQDMERSACVLVPTIQAFRVTNTFGRRIYAHNEELEAHFSGVPTDGMEVVSAEEAASNDMLREGAVKFSFANLLYHQRPLMIVDEAREMAHRKSQAAQIGTGQSRLVRSPCADD